MIYDMKSCGPDSVPRRIVKRVVDANGLEYGKTLRVDTESGEILKQLQDGDGRFVYDDGHGRMPTETVFAAPPVVVEFHPNEE